MGGGANLSCSSIGCGTIFNIAPSGTLTTLYSFCSLTGCDDGYFPNGLIQGRDGLLYGTTGAGGAESQGTIFKITVDGALTILHTFNGTDGASPSAGLIQASDGNFYGTTSSGGTNGDGTVFMMTPGGSLTTLHSFDGTDGASPSAGLIQASDGNFYGTTNLGGVAGSGTAFEITPSGVLSTLHSFCLQGGCSDGAGPNGLVQDTNGEFYGTSSGGGTDTACTGGCGTVFGLGTGLAPFVEAQRSFGKVGSAVNILGTNLTGATSVSFNGTAATFTVVAPSLITTTVPTGATTGKVQVATPSGTLSSNVPFRVLP